MSNETTKTVKILMRHFYTVLVVLKLKKFAKNSIQKNKLVI